MQNKTHVIILRDSQKYNFNRKYSSERKQKQNYGMLL